MQLEKYFAPAFELIFKSAQLDINFEFEDSNKPLLIIELIPLNNSRGECDGTISPKKLFA